MNDELMREIQQDVRRDKMEKYWARHGNSIISGVLILIFALASIAMYREHEINHAEAQTAAFLEANEVYESGDYYKATGLYRAIYHDSNDLYASLAGLRLAQSMLKDNDTAAAFEQYMGLAQNDIYDPLVRSLARLNAYGLSLEHGYTMDEALLSKWEEKYFPYSFAELQAVDGLLRDDATYAKERFDQLANNVVAPDTLKARAQMMSEAIQP